MDKLGSLIPASLKKGGAARGVKAAMLASAVEAAAARVVDDAEGKVKALSVKKGVARLRCASSVIAEEIRLHEREILKETAAKVGEDAVTKIVAVS